MLDEGKMGIFESPTGTGKSLSIICGSLTWLRDFKTKQKKILEEEIYQLETIADHNDDWFAVHTKKIENQGQLLDSKTKLNVFQKEELRIDQLKNTKKRKSDKSLYQEMSRTFKKPREDNDADLKDDGYTSDSDFLPIDFNIQMNNDVLEEEEEDEDSAATNTLKIFYCSRTHSQLAQFVREIQKSPYGKDARVITLGSRQNLCINETVKKLSNVSLINEKCTDMQKNKREKDGEIEKVKKRSNKNSPCPYFKRNPMEELRDASLIEVKDIEEIVDAAKKIKACPYYSVRLAVPDAEIVVLPYNMLLQKSMRESCGINLKGNVVIVDEAHNLLETIGSIHSISLSGLQISSCFNQLTHYMARFRTRLNAFNLLSIKQLLSILTAFIKILGGTVINTQTTKLSKAEQTCRILTLVEFLSVTEVDIYNFFDLLQYCEKSRIAHKLNGFSAAQFPHDNPGKITKTPLAIFLENKNTQPEIVHEPINNQISSTASFISVQDFLKCLTNSNKDGRVFVDKRETLQTSSLKFLLLNPAVYFLDVVKDARSIILAGGTMHPKTEFIDNLFKPSGLVDDDITLFSCGHVIPPNHLLPVVLEYGPSNIKFDFTFKNRGNSKLIEELGRLLSNLCSVTPGGIILFFPSYDYEDKVYTEWEKSGIIKRLSLKKKVFREPRKSSQTDQVLNEYSAAINDKSNGSGAVLLSIVGGKMSEGINFSDDLGRLVIMVGLPYPNIESPELKERIKYLSSNGKIGKQLPESLCMRAVNQSIGRAIRHSKDYAAILLLDERYKNNWVQAALPNWISQHLRHFEKFGGFFGILKKFYMDKKSI